MKLIIAIGAGSFIGGVFRYLVSQLVQAKFLVIFPFGTLTVNIIGCFLIGIVYGFSDKGNLTREWSLFLATGLRGLITIEKAEVIRYKAGK